MFLNYAKNTALMSFHNNPNSAKNGISVFGFFISAPDLRKLSPRDAEKVLEVAIGAEKLVEAFENTDLRIQLKERCKG